MNEATGNGYANEKEFYMDQIARRDMQINELLANYNTLLLENNRLREVLIRAGLEPDNQVKKENPNALPSNMIK